MKVKWVEIPNIHWVCTHAVDGETCGSAATMREKDSFEGRCQPHYAEMLLEEGTVTPTLEGDVVYHHQKMEPKLVCWYCSPGLCEGEVKKYIVNYNKEERGYCSRGVRCRSDSFVSLTPIDEPVPDNVEYETELVCGLGRAFCRGEVKEYRINDESETNLRCERCVDYYTNNIYTPIEDVTTPYPPSEVVTDLMRGGGMLNQAMIERDGEIGQSSKTMDEIREEFFRGVARELNEVAVSESIFTAWNRTNLIPPIVGFNPYIPRGE